MKPPELTPAEAHMVKEVERRLAEGERTIVLTAKEILLIQRALRFLQQDQIANYFSGDNDEAEIEDYNTTKESIRAKLK